MQRTIIALLVGLIFSFESSAATITATSSGNWSDTGIWDLMRLPAAGDFIIIPNAVIVDIIGVDITITGGAVTLLVQNGGGLRINNGGFGVNGTLILDSGSEVSIEPGGSLFSDNGVLTGWFVELQIGGNTVWDPFIFGGGSDPNPIDDATITEGGIAQPLPVELINFITDVSGSQVKLLWFTASEVNFDHFEVQRAVGLDEFLSIGSVKGAGEDVFEIQEYQFTDEKPLNGINYYRLKSIDLDGSFEYSDIQAVQVEANWVEIYPNPITEDYLRVDVANPSNQLIQLVDVSGRSVLNSQITAHNQIVELNGLKSGIYHIIVIDGLSRTTRKLIVD